MKILWLCVITFLLSGGANGQSSLAPLPPVIRTLLDQKFPAYPTEGFPGGRLADVSARDLQWLKNNGLNAAHPASVTGDFDGNGKEDYAVLVWYGTAEDQNKIAPNTFVVALLGQNSGYKLVELNPGGCSDCYKFLTIGRKGETRYEWQTGKSFVYQHDTLEAWRLDNEGRAYTKLANETDWGMDIMRFLASNTILGQLNAAALQAWPKDYRGKTFTGTVTSNDDEYGLYLEGVTPRNRIRAYLKPGQTVKLKDGTTRELKISDISHKRITIYYTEKESKDAQGNKVKIREIVGIRFPATDK